MVESFLELDASQGSERLDDTNGLVQAADFDILIFDGFNILQRNLRAAHLSEDDIQVKKEDLQILNRVSPQSSLGKLLVTLGNVISQFLRISNDGHLSPLSRFGLFFQESRRRPSKCRPERFQIRQGGYSHQGRASNLIRHEA
jgi:hypothetical protein